MAVLGLLIESHLDKLLLIAQVLLSPVSLLLHLEDAVIETY